MGLDNRSSPVGYTVVFTLANGDTISSWVDQRDCFIIGLNRQIALLSSDARPLKRNYSLFERTSDRLVVLSLQYNGLGESLFEETIEEETIKEESTTEPTLIN
jgi:hypothetical protein